MTTGQKIYACRKKAGLTQEELADRLGVTRQAVSKWESDGAFPETEKVLELCKLFSLSADELLFGKETGGAAETVPPQEAEKTEEKDGGKGSEWGVIAHSGKLRFEYISKTRLLGMPLVHVNIGFGCRAHGIVAVGLVAVGFVSLGLLSVGILALGLLSVGLFAFGNLALGWVAVGGVALGLMAVGGVALGLFALGGLAVGQLAVGGFAVGQFAFGDVARGYLAVGISRAAGAHPFVLKDGLETLAEWLEQNTSSALADFLLRLARLLG